MDTIKKYVAFILAAVSSMCGWFGWLVILYVCSMGLDFITGVTVAIKKHKWESRKAREGIYKKVGSIVAVLVALLTDFLLSLIINYVEAIHLPFNYSVLISPLVLIWYILTELGSVLENASELGAPLPLFLRKGIKKMQDSVEASALSHKNNEKGN